VSGWAERLDWELEAIMYVDYELEARQVVRYAVVLTALHEGRRHTARVYDGAHGVNELHRHTLAGGKQAGAPFHAGTLGEGMRAAISEVRRGYREMIEGWRS
jgi:hypothetical protein